MAMNNSNGVEDANSQWKIETTDQESGTNECKF